MNTDKDKLPITISEVVKYPCSAFVIPIKIMLFLFFIGAVKFTDAQYSPAPPPSDKSEVTPPSGYFEIGFGITQPVSSYANESGGGYGRYALPGNNVGISFGLPIEHSNFGVALMYDYSYNLYDINAYVNNIQVADQKNTYSAVTQDAYRESFIMAGLFATIPAQRFSFDFRVMGGVAICRLPEVDYQADATSLTASNNFEWDTYSSMSTAFAFDMGGGFRYKFRRLSLMAGLDFISTMPTVSTTQQYTDQYGNYSYSHVGNAVYISMLTYSLGIGYRIW